MGADLYWKITPKPIEEKLHGLSLSTWYTLAEIMEFKDKEDLSGEKMDKGNLLELRTMLLTAKACNNTEMQEDVQGLINGINKYDSITLTIRS